MQSKKPVVTDRMKTSKSLEEYRKYSGCMNYERFIFAGNYYKERRAEALFSGSEIVNNQMMYSIFKNDIETRCLKLSEVIGFIKMLYLDEGIPCDDIQEFFDVCLSKLRSDDLNLQNIKELSAAIFKHFGIKNLKYILSGNNSFFDEREIKIKGRRIKIKGFKFKISASLVLVIIGKLGQKNFLEIVGLFWSIECDISNQGKNYPAELLKSILNKTNDGSICSISDLLSFLEKIGFGTDQFTIEFAELIIPKLGTDSLNNQNGLQLFVEDNTLIFIEKIMFCYINGREVIAVDKFLLLLNAIEIKGYAKIYLKLFEMIENNLSSIIDYLEKQNKILPDGQKSGLEKILCILPENNMSFMDIIKFTRLATALGIEIDLTLTLQKVRNGNFVLTNKEAEKVRSELRNFLKLKVVKELELKIFKLIVEKLPDGVMTIDLVKIFITQVSGKQKEKKDFSDFLDSLLEKTVFSLNELKDLITNQKLDGYKFSVNKIDLIIGKFSDDSCDSDDMAWFVEKIADVKIELSQNNFFALLEKIKGGQKISFYAANKLIKLISGKGWLLSFFTGANGLDRNQKNLIGKIDFNVSSQSGLDSEKVLEMGKFLREIGLTNKNDMLKVLLDNWPDRYIIKNVQDLCAILQNFFGPEQIQNLGLEKENINALLEKCAFGIFSSFNELKNVFGVGDNSINLSVINRVVQEGNTDLKDVESLIINHKSENDKDRLNTITLLNKNQLLPQDFFFKQFSTIEINNYKKEILSKIINEKKIEDIKDIEALEKIITSRKELKEYEDILNLCDSKNMCELTKMDFKKLKKDHSSLKFTPKNLKCLMREYPQECRENNPTQDKQSNSFIKLLKTFARLLICLIMVDKKEVNLYMLFNVSFFGEYFKTFFILSVTYTLFVVTAMHWSFAVVGVFLIISSIIKLKQIFLAQAYRNFIQSKDPSKKGFWAFLVCLWRKGESWLAGRIFWKELLFLEKEEKITQESNTNEYNLVLSQPSQKQEKINSSVNVSGDGPVPTNTLSAELSNIPSTLNFLSKIKNVGQKGCDIVQGLQESI